MMKLPTFGPHISLERVPALLENAERAVEQIEQQKNVLRSGMPAKELAGLLAHYEEYVRQSVLAGSIIGVLNDLDSQNEQIRATRNFVQRRESELAERVLFFTLVLKQWSAEELERYGKELPRYRSWLHRIAQYAPHTLSEEEERIILYKDNTGESLLKNLYSQITSAYTFNVTVQGKRLTLTPGDLMPYLHHPEREVRKTVADAVSARYRKDNALLGEIYRGIAEDYDVEMVKLRNYKDILEPRHLANNIVPEAFTALDAACRRNQKLFQEYIELKRQALGYDEFTRYDFTAPVQGVPESITYEQATKRVLKEFKEFAPWMHDSAKKLFDEHCVDALPREGKGGGAACWGMVPGETPLLVMNFNGAYENLFTLAHELGHAVHDVLTAEHSVLTYHPPLVLAETASTFAETMILMKEIVSASPKQRIGLLCKFLDDANASIPAQMRYTRFELRAHELLSAGGTAEQLNELWATMGKEDYPAIQFPDSMTQWTAIPHIFQSPFYCYSYTFGLLFVLSLYRRYEEEGEAFIPKYKALLQAGGTVPPAELLHSLGYDVSSESFWGGGFSVLRERVSELRELLEKKS